MARRSTCIPSSAVGATSGADRTSSLDKRGLSPYLATPMISKRDGIQIKGESSAESSKEETSDTDHKHKRPRVAPKDDAHLASKKYEAWSPFVSQSPFPNYGFPTPEACEAAHFALGKLHAEDVEKEFDDENTPETIPHVLDAMIVAVLSQATGWSNAKRAMNSMKAEYGSIFAYDRIWKGGKEKLQDTIKCGGLHVRKSMIIMTMLEEVKKRQGEWDLDHLFDLDDDAVMKELLSYKYMGTKSASVVMGWCLKRNPFTVDTHVYRIAGLWGWRPENASKEKTQSHLEIMIPPRLKFDLHFYLIQHGRSCPKCRGGSNGKVACTIADQLPSIVK